MPATHDDNVFIDCPFDPDYRPLFEAVVFAVCDRGFFPRCALEGNDSSQVRIQKITPIIGECHRAHSAGDAAWESAKPALGRG